MERQGARRAVENQGTSRPVEIQGANLVVRREGANLAARGFYYMVIWVSFSNRRLYGTDCMS